MSTSTSNQFPVGAVVAYAGNANSANEMQGWYLCDGYELASDNSQALYTVIGASFGSNGSEFALPDFRGQFLRGVDAGTGQDPDAAGRSQPRPQLSARGNQAPYVGSVQMSAMVTHTHTHSRHTGYENTVAQDDMFSTDGDPDAANDNAQTRTSASAGRPEARPVNQAVNWMIKADKASSDLLVGAVLAYAGDLDTLQADQAYRDWMPCDGTQLEVAENVALSGVLSTLYGYDYESDFCLPCYQGRFLRGADSGTGKDPDALNRTAPRATGQYDAKINPGASSGVGSVQACAYPSHTHTYNGHDTDHILRQPNIGETCGVMSATMGSANFNSSGGTSSETRPVNIALEYIVASSTTAPLPSGAVIAYAGDINDADCPIDGWLPCDGRSLERTGDYAALYTSIGCAHGAGDDQSFNLPDLRGRFVRAVDHVAGIDKDARSTAASGGNPSGVGSWQGHALENHTHGYQTHTTTAEVLASFDSTSLDNHSTTDTSSAPTLVGSTAGDGTALFTISTENRPCNAYVYFLIKT